MDATQSYEKEQIQIKYLNKEAFLELILSINTNTAAGKVTFHIIKGYKTKYYTNGNAPKAWKRLCEKYIYKSVSTLNNIKRKFAKSRLREITKDPKEWIT